MERFGTRTSEVQGLSERYVFPFEKLEVWQDSLALADAVLGLIDRVPRGRHFRLISQIEGAVASISQNIAEGKGRQHRKEFLQYLSIAQGSLYETVTLGELFRKKVKSLLLTNQLRVAYKLNRLIAN